MVVETPQDNIHQRGLLREDGDRHEEQFQFDLNECPDFRTHFSTDIEQAQRIALDHVGEFVNVNFTVVGTFSACYVVHIKVDGRKNATGHTGLHRHDNKVAADLCRCKDLEPDLKFNTLRTVIVPIADVETEE